MSRKPDGQGSGPEIPDEDLMRYADGVASGADRRRIEDAMSRDGAIASRVAAFRRTSSAELAPMFDPVLDHPLPERLRAAALGLSSPVASADAQVAKPGLLDRILDALRRAMPNGPAMGVAFALASAAGLILAGPGLAPPAGNGFNIALETALSSEPIAFTAGDGARTLTPVITFRDKEARFCRVYELRRPGKPTHTGIACRTEGMWRIVFETDSGVLPSGGRYVPAGADAELNSRLEEMRSGDALSREEEIALTRRGWIPK